MKKFYYSKYVNRPINDSKTCRIINTMNDGRILFVDEGRILVSSNSNMNGTWLDITDIVINDTMYDEEYRQYLKDIDSYEVFTDDEYILVFVNNGSDFLKIKYDFYKGIKLSLVHVSEVCTSISNIDGHIFGLASNGLDLKILDIETGTWITTITFDSVTSSYLNDYDKGKYGIYPINSDNTFYISNDLSGAWTTYSSSPNTAFTTPIYMKLYEDTDLIMFTDSNDTIVRIFNTNDSSWNEVQMNFTDPNYPSNKIIGIFRLSDNIYGFIDGLSKYIVVYDFDTTLQNDFNRYEPSDYHISTHGGVFVIELNDDILIQTKNDGIVYSKKENIDVPTT